MEKAQNGLFLIFFLIKNEKLWVRNRSHTEFCGDPEKRDMVMDKLTTVEYAASFKGKVK